MKTLLIPIVLLLACACNQPMLHPSDAAGQQQNARIEHRVDSVLKLMTLEEKIGQLTLYTSDYDVTGPTLRPGYKEDIKAGRVGAIFNAVGVDYVRSLQEMAVKETRLHIPLLFGYDVIHGQQTMFPMPMGEAASWDLELIEKDAHIAAAEAAAQGLDWTFAPMCDITRDPRWGRVCEGAGEDPFLGAAIAAARVHGFQGNNPADTDRVMACVKHFAAYGAPLAGRDYAGVNMSERQLRDVYLVPYHAAVKAGARTVMTAFNDLNGVPATANKFLLTQILRDEWGFTGFVVTDYTSIMELIPHGVAADTAQAAALAFNAGVDMDMQSGFFNTALPALVKNGTVRMADIDNAVKRILRVKFELGLFDDPFRNCNTAREQRTLMKPEFLETARDAARKSMVLLKNENNTLPLHKKQQTIAFIGPLVKDQRNLIGSWSAQGDWHKAVSIWDGVTMKTDSTRLLYAKGANLIDDSSLLRKLNDHGGNIVTDTKTPEEMIQEAMKVARQADVVVAVLGEAQGMSGEAASRSDIGLPENQQALLHALKQTGKPIVLVLLNGRPLTLSWEDAHMNAILEAWFPGTEAGNAVADVLFGDYNPSGKLPMTFPRMVGQIPIFYAEKNTGRPFDANSKYTSKYLDVQNTPLYPFGYGLSYTHFSYSGLQLSRTKIGMKDTLTVTVTVKNDGAVNGEEVVQLYVRDLVASVTRPVKELKGFQKVALAAGESRMLHFKITAGDLRYYDQFMHFVVEPGTFTVFAGGNSQATLAASFELVNE